jgi:hypothetical protein
VVVSQNAIAPALRQKEARLDGIGGDWRLRLKKVGGVKRAIQPIKDGSGSPRASILVALKIIDEAEVNNLDACETPRDEISIQFTSLKPPATMSR